MRWLYALFCGVVLVACVLLASRSQAAEVQVGYDYLPGGAVQLNGHPIGQSLFTFDFTGAVGPVDVGGMVEADQDGRAGPASDRLSVHIGKSFSAGPVTLTPRLLLGYARGLDADEGLIGGELTSFYQLSPWLSLEGAVRFRHSFAENAAPLNSAELPHTAWQELALHGGPVFQVSSKLALGLNFERDLGTTPDVRLGSFLRLGF